MKLAKKIIFIFLALITLCQSEVIPDTEFECGQRAETYDPELKPLIVGGTPVKNRLKWPFIAAFWEIGSSTTTFFGAGSLISTRSVLSASHIFKAKNEDRSISPDFVEVLFGRLNLSDTDEPGSTKRGVLKIIVHPEWSIEDKKYDADIALVILKSPVEFNEFIRPICLPPQSDDEMTKKGVVVGWGKSGSNEIYSETLNELVSPIYNKTKCFDEFPLLMRYSSQRMFCSGYSGLIKSACTGDSGGGFFTFNKTKKKFVVDGVTSSSLEDEYGDCRTDIPTLYTKVGRFSDWIINVTKENENPKEIEVGFECEFGHFHDCKHTYNGSFDEILKIKISNDTLTSKTEIFLNFDPSPKIFSGIGLMFPNLKELQIRGGFLKSLKRLDFKNLEKLEKLTLYVRDSIYIADDAFEELHELREIQIPLLTVFTNFKRYFALNQNLTTIRIFPIYENEKIPKNFFKRFPKIEELDLSWNRNEFADVVFDLPDTLKLDLSNSEVKPTKKMFSKLKNLKYLSLKGCNLSMISDDTFDPLKNLEELLLSRTVVKPTKQMFSSLKKLKYLSLIFCDLLLLPVDTFEPLGNLEKLKLSFSKVQPTKQMFLKSKNLKQLYLRDCDLSSMSDDAFEHLESLEELDLGMTKIKPTKQMFSKLKNLKILNLDFCDFSSLPNDIFKPLENLEVLDAISLKVKPTKKMFSSLKKLRMLNLSWSYSSKVCFGINRLSCRYIYTDFRLQPDDIFTQLEHLERLELSGALVRDKQMIKH